MFQDIPQSSPELLVLSGLEQNPRPKNYNVLSRKYRPQTFKDLIGQEVTITALANALISDRMPHAMVLTGIQGVGKTTIARIIAQCLNCITNDKASAHNCQQCSQCTSIAISQNQDVLEMDAASNTSVNDIREIIENSRYRPSIGRYRIYIIDEVHMLSNSAFNALLKTLEEPPSYVKFILATTEIRKIPITVLSRCQRFNLRRLNFDELENHYSQIITKEGYTSDKEAVASIAKAASGSVRDGLSMLDQAIMITLPNKHIEASSVRAMLGYGERTELYHLLELIVMGQIQESMEVIRNIYYNNSYDPYIMLNDMTEIVHGMIISKSEEKILRSHEGCDKETLERLLPKFSMPFLLRAWQILLSAIQDMRSFNQSLGILEVTAMKLICVNLYETPESVVQLLNKSFRQAGGFIYAKETDSLGSKSDNTKPQQQNSHTMTITDKLLNTKDQLYTTKPQQQETHELPETKKINEEVAMSIQGLLSQIASFGDIVLYNILHGEVEIKNFNLATKFIHISIPTTQDSTNVIRQIKAHISRIIPGEWQVKVDVENAINTINTMEITAIAAKKEQIIQDPLVKSVLSSFPGASIDKIIVT